MFENIGEMKPNLEVVKKHNAWVMRFNPPNGDEYFEALCRLAMLEGISCGECEGFVCHTCYRGRVACYALRNDEFYKYISDERNAEVSGVEIIRKSLRVLAKL